MVAIFCLLNGDIELISTTGFSEFHACICYVDIHLISTYDCYAASLHMTQSSPLHPWVDLAHV